MPPPKHRNRPTHRSAAKSVKASRHSPTTARYSAAITARSRRSSATGSLMDGYRHQPVLTSHSAAAASETAMLHTLRLSRSRASSDASTNPTHTNGTWAVGFLAAGRVGGAAGLMVADMAVLRIQGVAGSSVTPPAVGHQGRTSQPLRVI